MRITLVAAVLGLLGCAGSNSDPGSVVQGLSQQQIDETDWLYNVETRDLVAADALQGALDGFQAVEVRRVGYGVLACGSALNGVVIAVLLDGETQPGQAGDVVQPDDVDHDVAQVGDIFPGRQLRPSQTSTDVETDDDFGIARFDEDILQAMQSEEGFYAFHPGCT
jgi:hypothetical protein